MWRKLFPQSEQEEEQEGENETCTNLKKAPPYGRGLIIKCVPLNTLGKTLETITVEIISPTQFFEIFYFYTQKKNYLATSPP